MNWWSQQEGKKGLFWNVKAWLSFDSSLALLPETQLSLERVGDVASSRESHRLARFQGDGRSRQLLVLPSNISLSRQNTNKCSHSPVLYTKGCPVHCSCPRFCLIQYQDCFSFLARLFVFPGVNCCQSQTLPTSSIKVRNQRMLGHFHFPWFFCSDLNGTALRALGAFVLLSFRLSRLHLGDRFSLSSRLNHISWFPHLPFLIYFLILMEHTL